MKREIKFRGWQDGKMCEIDGNSQVTLCFNKISGWNIGLEPMTKNLYWLMGESASGGDFVLMQFTGLKDKSGKEGYEGDIIERQSSYDIRKKVRGKILFKDGSFIVEWAQSVINGGWNDILKYHLPDSEIIGNMCQNPELFK